jgi:hypothetical protein
VLTKLITVYWRDIPAQVIGRQGRKSVFKKTLHPRFQRAIDRAAMRAGRGSSNQYLADWRRESRPCDGDVEQAVNDEVSRLERGFPPDVLDTVVRASGLVTKDAGGS